MANPEWVLVNGEPVDLAGALALMNGNLRAQLQLELSPCSTQEFMDAYVAAHHVAFGEDFVIVTAPSP